MEDSSKIVVVTGFGPFGEHKINASWEAVKLLKGYNIDGIKLVTKEVPVRYVDVDNCVPEIWKEHQPNLVIHVGVSKFARRITIETKACRDGYIKPDCDECFHPTGNACAVSGDCEVICTGVDASKLLETLGNRDKFQLSTDAGRYLCEYIYYKSLKMCAEKTLFVHVPLLGEPFTAAELADGLCDIIRAAINLD